LLASCTVPLRIERRTGPTLASVDPSAKLLKVHMRNGDVYLLYSWTLDGTQLIGRGEHRGPDRARIPVTKVLFRLESNEIALYETDTKIKSPVGIGMKLFTTASLILSVVTITMAVNFVSAWKEFFI